jgi:hypothetical protein
MSCTTPVLTAAPETKNQSSWVFSRTCIAVPSPTQMSFQPSLDSNSHSVRSRWSAVNATAARRQVITMQIITTTVTTNTNPPNRARTFTKTLPSAKPRWTSPPRINLAANSSTTSFPASLRPAGPPDPLDPRLASITRELLRQFE